VLGETKRKSFGRQRKESTSRRTESRRVGVFLGEWEAQYAEKGGGNIQEETRKRTGARKRKTASCSWWKGATFFREAEESRIRGKGGTERMRKSHAGDRNPSIADC